MKDIFIFKYGDGNNNPSNGGPYPVFGAGGIQGGYTEFNAENFVIIGHMGDAGCVSWGEGKHFVTYNGTITKPKDDVFSSKFGYYLLSKMNLRKYRGGSGLPFLTYDMLNDMDTVIPPDKSECEKISECFSLLDNLITLHQRDSLSRIDITWEKTNVWEQRKLGDIATFINGRAYSQEELLSSGKYKVLRVGNFYTNDSWYYSDLELDDKYYAEEGDLLYTWSATFGPHIWHGDKVIYHYHIWKVELSEYLEKRFAVQLLEQDKAAILSDKNGSTMVHITKAGMEGKIVLIPKNVNEQAKIGAYFDELDNLITLHQRKYRLLIEMEVLYAGSG